MGELSEANPSYLGLNNAVDAIKQQIPTAAVYVRNVGHPWTVVFIDSSGKSFDENFLGLTVNYNLGGQACVTTIKPSVIYKPEELAWHKKAFFWKMLWRKNFPKEQHILILLQQKDTWYNRFREIVRNCLYMLKVRKMYL